MPTEWLVHVFYVAAVDATAAALNAVSALLCVLANISERLISF
jgi:hypothetical protein